MTQKLKIGLMYNDNNTQLLYKVVEQEGFELGNFKYAKNGFTIKNKNYPMLADNYMEIRGIINIYDNNLDIYYTLKMQEYLKGMFECLHSYFGKGRVYDNLGGIYCFDDNSDKNEIMSKINSESWTYFYFEKEIEEKES